MKNSTCKGPKYTAGSRSVFRVSVYRILGEPGQKHTAAVINVVLRPKKATVVGNSTAAILCRSIPPHITVEKLPLAIARVHCIIVFPSDTSEQ